MKPTMLITGASRGIGRACAAYFAKTHRVYTVARTGNVTDQGDLTDAAFLRRLIAKYPTVDVLINNAGGHRPGFADSVALNFTAPGILMEHYAFTMQGGHIINVTSNCAYGAEGFDMGYSEVARRPRRLWYAASKHAAKYLSNMLSRSCPNVRITSIEPGRVDQNGAGLRVPHVKVERIPEMIAWILAQPYQIHTLHFTP